MRVLQVSIVASLCPEILYRRAPPYPLARTTCTPHGQETHTGQIGGQGENRAITRQSDSSQKLSHGDSWRDEARGICARGIS